MAEGSVVSIVNANAGAAESRQNKLPATSPENLGNILPQAEWFAVMARELWQFKVGAHLQNHLGYSDRTCRAWASAESEPPARALALLLRTEDGPRVLEYVMRGSNTPWWTELLRAKSALAQLK